MLFRVTSLAFDAKTGKIIKNKKGNARIECIDTKNNELFYDYGSSAYGIKQAYESFWNDIHSASEIVSVISVEKIKKEQFNDKIVWLTLVY